MATVHTATHVDDLPEDIRLAETKKAAKSGFFGALAEYYDFGLYGTASALIFPVVFFGGADNPQLATIASLGSFGVAYLARPLGAVVLGHLGDTWGRKNTLYLTLGLMGFATMVIGFLPSYEAIGPAAAIILLLMRLIQGFSAGGEQAGSNTLTSEWAPPARRGHFTAFTMHGLALGQLLALGAFIPFSGDDSFLFGIGWRIPYFIAIPIILYALWVRSKVSDPITTPTSPVEAPDGQAADRTDAKAPDTSLRNLFANHWRSVLRVICMGQYAITGTLLGNYALNYGTTQWGIEKNVLLALATGSMVFGLAVQPAWASLSDRIGRRPVYLTSMIALVLLFPVMFYALQTQNGWFIAVMFTIVGLVATGGNVVQASLYTELFPTEVRMAGYAVSTQIGNIIVGFTPMISAILVRPGAFGWVPVLAFTSAMMTLGIIACFTTKETRGSVIV
ncbi:MFS transporter [Corynebacterium uterequi]|uniref:Nitrate/nitrite transporter n=1 Tax=Corynebacterium uterequi TaxID=1072256 RepID=A0A0G3HKV2_9CORY|nr:MFS transporter [Corynebacterium uterequi]AKK11727.1 nitrate/nitrite transporter [Corynebacterium uterequi]